MAMAQGEISSTNTRRDHVTPTTTQARLGGRIVTTTTRFAKCYIQQFSQRRNIPAHPPRSKQLDTGMLSYYCLFVFVRMALS